MKLPKLATSFILLFVCTINGNLSAQNPDEKSYYQYFIDPDNDGNYDSISFDKKTEPQPIQGMVQFGKDLSRNIKYPFSARNNGIEGQVVLSLYVDQTGKITDIKVKKTVHKSLVDSSIQALSIASQEGFWPFIFENKPTRFIMDVTLSYKLEGK
jgi:TonB family protein